MQCARREFVEETGLAIRQFHEDCRVELHYTANIRNYAIERTLVYYLAEVDSGEIALAMKIIARHRGLAPGGMGIIDRDRAGAIARAGCRGWLFARIDPS